MSLDELFKHLSVELRSVCHSTAIYLPNREIAKSRLA